MLPPLVDTHCHLTHGRFAADLPEVLARAREAGGIQAEDRHGVPRFFPCTTLAIGAVAVRLGRYHRAEDVASAAALAKHQAKTSGSGGLFVLGTDHAQAG